MTQQEANKITAFIQTLVGEEEKVTEAHGTETPTDSPRRCQVHTFNGEPVILKAREKKDGSGVYFDHRTQVNGVWKKCFGHGYVD